jgi:filamentous hemagglutinin
MATLVGQIASELRDNAQSPEEQALWDEGGAGRALLHAIGSGILGGVNGWEGALKGALGGAATTLLAPAIDKLVRGMLKGTKYDGTKEGEALAALIGASLAAGVGGVVGGGEGAAYGAANYQYNYLNDKQALALRHAVDACAEGDGNECTLKASLGLIDEQSDQNVVAACAGGRDSPDCGEALDGLRAAYASLVSGRDGLSAYDQAFLEAYMRTELELLSDPDGSKRFIAGFLMGGGAAAEGAVAAQRAVAREVAAVSPNYSAIGSTGKVGELYLESLGGKSQQYFSTSLGGRFIDQLVNGMANESKVGYTTLTKGIQTQIAKDVELKATDAVKDVTWHFFKSPVTGMGGPSQQLLNSLQQNGINVVIH